MDILYCNNVKLFDLFFNTITNCVYMCIRHLPITVVPVRILLY